MFRKSVGAILFFLILTTASSAFAGLIEVEFTATVNVVDDFGNVMNGSINPGDQITGTYTLDNSWIDNDPHPDYAWYNMPAPLPSGIGFTFNLPNLTYTPSNTDTNLDVYTGNNIYDHYTIASHPSVGNFSNGAVLDHVFIDLFDPSGQTLSTTSIDTNIALLNSMPEKRLWMDGYGFHIEATVTSLEDLKTTCETPDEKFNYGMEIVYVDDPSNGLGEMLKVGDQISGSFDYNPATIDVDPSNLYGLYPHSQGDSQAKVTINIGGITVTNTNTSLNSRYEVFIHNNPDFGGIDDFAIGSFSSNMALPNGSIIDDYFIYLTDFDGKALYSDILSEADPLPLSKWKLYDVMAYGHHADGSWFHFRGMIKTLAVGQEEPPHIPVTVSPATGTFIPMQQFDASVVVDSGLPPVTSVMVEVSDGIYPFPLYCSPPFMALDGRQFAHCPNASQQLRPGMNNVTITVHFLDNSIITNTATWELLQ